MRLVVGIADGLPKLEVQRLLRPVLATPNLHLVCHEGEIADLMADLVVHRLDVVLADRPAPAHAQLKVHSHALGGSDIGWFATEHWYEAARVDYPQSLSRVPLLLPTTHSHVRGALDQWLLMQALTPSVAGEFEDSALLEAFGGNGMGAFPAALAVADDLLRRHGARLLGTCDGVRESFFAVTAQRRVEHPLVRLMLDH